MKRKTNTLDLDDKIIFQSNNKEVTIHLVSKEDQFNGAIYISVSHEDDGVLNYHDVLFPREQIHKVIESLTKITKEYVLLS